ncbi:hypothetical protein U91I_00861 [alpha proteobacterium U9-1i]|nr:hypothetical protein U91I_00861 [alpha proteobacterium U9-1i]
MRLEVDLRFPSGLALSGASSERLRVRRLPLVGVRVGVDGGASLRGRVARPRIEFGDEASRAWTAVFQAPVTTRADGVIGPGALPHDIVTVTLGPEPAAARDIVFTLEDADVWIGETQVGGETMRVSFDLAHGDSVFNRTAARHLDASGAIVSNGELAERHLILGLRTLMQPVRTELTVERLSLGPTFARTNSPLLGADEADAIVVQAEAENAAPAAVMLGRDALAGCSSISVNRQTRRMTLRCAG